MRSLVMVLGDQLSPSLSALRGLEPSTTRVLLCEVDAEARYAPHHAQKLVVVLAAMRHFADWLRDRGFQVDHVALDDAGNSHSLTGELERALARHGPATLRMTLPGEWRVLQDFQQWSERSGVVIDWQPDDHFLCSREDFASWAQGRRQLRMEHFYRQMRRQHRILMADAEPEGGRWNFDADNRKALPPPLARPPQARPMAFAPDAVTRQVMELVARRFPDAFGQLEGFDMAVTTGNARRALTHFVKTALPWFGDYQDAMAADDGYLYHARISVYLNLGLLDPLECCQAAEQAWRDGAVPLNAAEGFIRQILGWREFVRGIYWLHMPEYARGNALDAHLPLPDFYWTGRTGMRCLARTVQDIREQAYAHHIQRLMVTGNFALIAGIEPRAVCDWYLGVFADAFEWVELPNTLGMALYGDGGVFATKPYAASGRYIERMSDYCQGCRYDPKQAEGETACPFNYLYWDFVARNADRLRSNPRMGLVLRNLERQAPERVQAMRAAAQRARQHLDAL